MDLAEVIRQVLGALATIPPDQRRKACNAVIEAVRGCKAKCSRKRS